MKRFFQYLILIVYFYSCSSKTEVPSNDAKIPVAEIASKDPKTSEPPGIIGIIELPEILTLACKDSAAEADIGFKMGQAYSAIEADIDELKLETDGMPAGAIYYNNNPKNFIFECVVPITFMPKTQPKRTTIVVLEATKALVYNYYGPNNKIHTAYDELRDYLKQNHLEQSTPAREFYLSDATVDTDPTNWLTKIYIPVK